MISIIENYKQKRWAIIFVIYLRYLIGAAFVFSSMPKVLGERFLSSDGGESAINTFPHLFETLYYSGIYWQFLGWGQLLAGLLLSTQIFATLGALAFLPIALNIFFISITYELGIGLPIMAILLILANVFLLLWDYEKLIVLFMPDNVAEYKIEKKINLFYNDRFWSVLGLIIFITTVIYVYIYDRDPNAWFFICTSQGLLGFIYMIRKYKLRAAGVVNT